MAPTTETKVAAINSLNELLWNMIFCYIKPLPSLSQTFMEIPQFCDDAEKTMALNLLQWRLLSKFHNILITNQYRVLYMRITAHNFNAAQVLRSFPNVKKIVIHYKSWSTYNSVLRRLSLHLRVQTGLHVQLYISPLGTSTLKMMEPYIDFGAWNKVQISFYNGSQNSIFWAGSRFSRMLSMKTDCMAQLTYDCDELSSHPCHWTLKTQEVSNSIISGMQKKQLHLDVHSAEYAFFQTRGVWNNLQTLHISGGMCAGTLLRILKKCPMLKKLFIMKVIGVNDSSSSVVFPNIHTIHIKQYVDTYMLPILWKRCFNLVDLKLPKLLKDVIQVELRNIDHEAFKHDIKYFDEAVMLK